MGVPRPRQSPAEVPPAFSSTPASYRLPRMDYSSETAVKARAHSPGRYPVLIVELPDGGLRATYSETGYDLERAKTVGEDWLNDNAIGRHSFVEIDPPREMPASSIAQYVRGELLG